MSQYDISNPDFADGWGVSVGNSKTEMLRIISCPVFGFLDFARGTVE